ncbi:MAG: hypothetical protein ACLUDF_00850 [Butyricicoccus sp.]
MKKTTMPGMPEVEVVEIKTSAPVNVLADPAPAKKPAAKRTRKTAAARQLQPRLRRKSRQPSAAASPRQPPLLPRRQRARRSRRL